MEHEPVSFEESLAELGQIVQILERGQPTLEESLSRFERGVELLRICRARLDSADARIRELVDIDEHGHARLKEFDHQASHSAEETSSEPRVKKARRRTPSAKTSDPPSDQRLFE